MSKRTIFGNIITASETHLIDRNKNMSKINEDNKKSTEDQALAYINLKVRNQEGNVLFFKVRRDTRFRKLMNAYCDRVSEGLGIYAFLFDGRRIRPEQTPNEIYLENGDEIDALEHHAGGGRV